MIGRRDFITLVGGSAAVWPLAAHAQQPAMPVVGFLHSGSPQGRVLRIAAFRQGLAESGYVEGQNVTIEYHWAEEQYERLSTLAANLAQRQVTMMIALAINSRSDRHPALPGGGACREGSDKHGPHRVCCL
jgi:putative ABC transport system substrate-binding protein